MIRELHIKHEFLHHRAFYNRFSQSYRLIDSRAPSVTTLMIREIVHGSCQGGGEARQLSPRRTFGDRYSGANSLGVAVKR